MKIQLEERLAELKEELEKGQAIMADLKAKETNLRESMLKIQGAIQVLEEELSRDLSIPQEQEIQDVKQNGA